MSDKNKGRIARSGGTILSDFARSAKSAKTLALSPPDLGQRYPHPCPEQCPPFGSQSAEVATDLLGAPLSIREVARMFGCSEWTVRQRLMRVGLPHFRLTPNGKLVFFHNQVVRWVLDRQRQKGGYIP